MRYAIEATYITGALGFVHFEEETWDDVEDWYIKWDALHVKFKGQSEWREYELDSDSTYGTDWKRPTNVTVYSTDEDGLIDYTNEIDGKD